MPSGTPAVSEPLYMCERDKCSMTGLYSAAMRHERDTGHNTVRLTDAESSGLRAAWRAQNRCFLCGGRDHEHEGCLP